jgi:hypothetical protein
MSSQDHLGITPPLQDPTTASPWVPLWRIIEQIASAIGDSREAEHYAKTRLYIRQLAAEGRLRIRGRHEIEVAGQERTNFSEIYTEIPSAYWKYSVINVLATNAASEADRHTAPEKTPYAWGPKGLYEPNCYTGLQLNSNDVSQLKGTGLLADPQMPSLKPTLWGMSINLLNRWNWLQERTHFLGRKTASILSRLWRDPVWSKVIATGITAGIGLVLYLTNVYHSTGPHNAVAKAWIRIGSSSDVSFDSIPSAGGEARTVRPYGSVTGVVSDAHLDVFLLIRMIPRNSTQISPSDYLAGRGWRIAQGVVDASGNWTAPVCFTPYVYVRDAPDFEYWELLSIATTDAATINSAITYQTCGISEEVLKNMKTIICSETKVMMRPPDRGGYFIDHSASPRSRSYCFGRKTA